MSQVGSGLKHTAAVGGASGCVTEGSVLPGSARASGEKHQQPGGNVASTDGGEFEREVRCQKNYLIDCIEELGREVSLCTDRQELSLCWNKLEHLGKDVRKFYQFLSARPNGDTAAFADVGDNVGLTFESLRPEMSG